MGNLVGYGMGHGVVWLEVLILHAFWDSHIHAMTFQAPHTGSAARKSGKSSSSNQERIESRSTERRFDVENPQKTFKEDVFHIISIFVFRTVFALHLSDHKVSLW